MAPRAAALRGTDTELADHLVQSACRLLTTGDPGVPTVRAIAGEAGVAVGVLYNHFADKEQLLALALHAHVRGVEGQLGPPPGPAGTGTLRANLISFVERALDLHAAVLPAFVALATEPGVLRRFVVIEEPGSGEDGLRHQLGSYLRAEQRLGRVAPEANVEMAVTVIVGACHELVLPALFAGTGVDGLDVPPAFADEVVQIVLHGVAAEG